MKKLFRKILILTVVFFSFSLITIADPPGPPGPGGTPIGSGGTPVGAPIDGGLSILLALGIGYGARKFYQARKEKKEADDELMS